MKVIESFTEGKYADPERNEDKIIVTDHFIAVLDGVTTKSCPLIAGKSGGRFAVDTAEKTLIAVAPDVTASDMVKALSSTLREDVTGEISLAPEQEHPAYGIIIYSRARREVWRVADLCLMIDGQKYLNEIPADKITSEARAFMIEAALLRSMTLEEIVEQDIGRDYILPMLKEQHYFTNKVVPYGFGDINGDDVPQEFIQIFDVKSAAEIVMASDGYPHIFPTLAETEGCLKDILREDPLLFRKFKATKGLKPGQVSFDDRAYIRFRP